MNRSPRMSTWRIILRSYRCGTCGALPGEPCMTLRGRVADIEHVARQNLTDRCPHCAAMLPADWPPAALCERCQLVRDLEVERARRWQRAET